MNRQERRVLEKKVKKRGVSGKDAKAYVEIISNADKIQMHGAEETSVPKKFKDGDKVMLNIDLIKARKNYEQMADAYKEFVDGGDGVVFTARVERENMISLVESPDWLFWSGDLNKVEPKS